MRSSYSYAPVFTSTVASADGDTYAAHIERLSYSGAVTTLGMVALRIAWGADGGAVTPTGPLAPLGSSRAVLTVADPGGVLAECVGAADGTWRLRVNRTTGSGDVADGGAGIVWLGYLLPEYYEDTPYAAESRTSLTFVDALGLLDARPVAGSGAEVGTTTAIDTPDDPSDPSRVLLDILSRHLTDLYADEAAGTAAGAGGLTTAVDWRPWMDGDEVAASLDPLRQLYALEDAWLPVEGQSVSVYDALRAIAARFNARLYQSAGRWHLTQRGLLCRTAGASVPRFAYASGTAPAAVTVDSDTLTVDTRTWPQAGPHEAVARGITLPVSSIGASYEFRPGLSDVLLNSSFEDAGSGGATDAEFWTQTEPTETVCDRVAKGSGMTAAGDAWALEMQSTYNDYSAPTVEQADRVFIVGAEGLDLDLDLEVETDYTAASVDAMPQVEISLGYDGTTYYMTEATVTCRGASYKGKKAPVTIDPLVGTPSAGDYRPILYNKGTDIVFPDVGGAGVDATLTLTEPARYGDVTLYGDLDVNLADADTATVHYFNASSASLTVGEDVQRLTYRFTAALVATSGAAVVGHLSVLLRGAVGPTRPGGPGVPPSPPTTTWDRIRARVIADREGVDNYGALVSLTAGAPGTDAALPTHGLGDGPSPATRTALYVKGDDAGQELTAQGPDTGWKEGAYSAAEASTGKTLDVLGARDALRQLAGPVERVRTTYLLRDGAALAPEHVPVHWPTTALVHAAAASATTIYTRAAPREGRTVRVGGAAYTVDTVTRGAGLYVVALTSGLAAAAAAGDRVAYDVPVWWDAMEWDVPTGRVLYDATALDLYPSTDYVEQLQLSA